MSLVDFVYKSPFLSTEKTVAHDQEVEIATSKNGQNLRQLVIALENLRKKIEKGYEPSKISPTYLAKIPLIAGMSCYTEYAIGREIAIRYYLHPLHLPPISISHLIKPLEIFVLKESREDPHFNITIREKNEDTENLGGRFLPSTGNIELFVPQATHPLKALPLSQGPSTALIHEVCHKVIDKLIWDNQPSYPKSPYLEKIFLAHKKDEENLRKTLWQKTHISMQKFKQVRWYSSEQYSPEKLAEEYFVRIPEILFVIANEQPARSLEEIEKILIENTPSLYKIYRDEFLPALNAYNIDQYEKPKKLARSKLKTTFPGIT